MGPHQHAQPAGVAERHGVELHHELLGPIVEQPGQAVPQRGRVTGIEVADDPHDGVRVLLLDLDGQIATSVVGVSGEAHTWGGCPIERVEKRGLVGRTAAVQTHLTIHQGEIR